MVIMFPSQNFHYLEIPLTCFPCSLCSNHTGLLAVLWACLKCSWLLHVLSHVLFIWDLHDTSPHLSSVSTLYSSHLPCLFHLSLLIFHNSQKPFSWLLDTAFLWNYLYLFDHSFLMSFMACFSSVYTLTARYPFLILCNFCHLLFSWAILFSLRFLVTTYVLVSSQITSFSPALSLSSDTDV